LRVPYLYWLTVLADRCSDPIRRHGSGGSVRRDRGPAAQHAPDRADLLAARHILLRAPKDQCGPYRRRGIL